MMMVVSVALLFVVKHDHSSGEVIIWSDFLTNEDDWDVWREMPDLWCPLAQDVVEGVAVLDGIAQEETFGLKKKEIK